MSKHTPADKTKALTVAEIAGNRAASETLGIPIRTVQAWRQQGISDPEVANLVKRAVSRATEELLVEASGLVVDAAVLVRRSIQQLVEREEPLTPSQLRDISISAGIWHDKLADLQGRSSVRLHYGQGQQASLTTEGPSSLVLKLLEGMTQQESPDLSDRVPTEVDE